VHATFIHNKNDIKLEKLAKKLCLHWRVETFPGVSWSRAGCAACSCSSHAGWCNSSVL